MNKFKISTVAAIALYAMLAAVFLSGCKQTYYNYEIEKIIETCKDRGGVHRFNSDMDRINCWCNDGSFHKLR